MERIMVGWKGMEGKLKKRGEGPLCRRRKAGKRRRKKPPSLWEKRKTMHRKMCQTLKNTARWNRLAPGVARWAPWAMGALYAGCGLRLWRKKGGRALPGYVLPLGETYMISGLLRRAINAPRPFEQMGKLPLLPQGKGRAFPSRHAACAGVMTALSARVLPGAWLPGLLLTGLIANSRVACRLHSRVDVWAGALLGLGVGVLPPPEGLRPKTRWEEPSKNRETPEK